MIKIVIVKLINWLSHETKTYNIFLNVPIGIIFFNNQLTLSRRSI